MSIYWKLLRLHGLWFILYNLLCIVILVINDDARPALFIKMVGYPAINFISRPFNKRYDYYFENMGFSPQRLFILISLIDLSAFIVFIMAFKVLF